MSRSGIIIDEPTRLLRITRCALAQMQSDEPDLALAFLHAVIQHLANRIMQNDRSVQALK